MPRSPPAVSGCLCSPDQAAPACQNPKWQPASWQCPASTVPPANISTSVATQQRAAAAWVAPVPDDARCTDLRHTHRRNGFLLRRRQCLLMSVKAHSSKTFSLSSSHACTHSTHLQPVKQVCHISVTQQPRVQQVLRDERTMGLLSVGQHTTQTNFVVQAKLRSTDAYRVSKHVGHVPGLV